MNVRTFIQTIPDAQDISDHYKFIDETAKASPMDLLLIFEFLSAQEKDLDGMWQLRAVYGRILEAVCLHAGVDQISTALALWDRVKREKQKRRIAAYLASSQQPNELFNTVLQRKHEVDAYFVSLVTHELVCRGHDLRKHLHFFDFASDINRESIFKGLTLFPLTAEHDLPLRGFNVGSSGYSPGPGLYDLPFAKLRTERKTIHDFNQVDEITLATRNWVDESGGTTVGIKGSLSKMLGPQELLEQLDYAPFHAEAYKLRALNPNQMFQRVFNACANGGAYNDGEYAATGRLYTWQSIHAMTCDDAFEDISITESKLDRYDWYEFVLNEWFINEWLDLGIMAIAKDAKTFAIMAATDTD